MKRACIAIVDAAQARIYTYNEAYNETDNEADGEADSEVDHEVDNAADNAAEDLGCVRLAADPRLHREVDLVNPVRRGHDLFSMRLGLERPAGSNGSSGDHHAAQLDKLERTFVRHVIEELHRIAAQRGFAHILVMATPEVLGELRTLDAALQRPDLVLEYIERDLARLTSPQTHGHLAQPWLFGARPRPAPVPR